MHVSAVFTARTRSLWEHNIFSHVSLSLYLSVLRVGGSPCDRDLFKLVHLGTPHPTYLQADGWPTTKKPSCFESDW